MSDDLIRRAAEEGFLDEREARTRLAGRPATAETLVDSGLLTREQTRALLSSELPADVAELAGDPARRFGHFIRIRQLGRGGFGTVDLVWDTRLYRRTALKILKDADPEEVARFQREARLAAGLSHPNIAAVYEVGDVAGTHFISMQYVDGDTLSRLRLSVKEAVAAVREAAEAVAHAHESGIIHRDLKPHNIMRNRQGQTFVLDFGLARSSKPGSSMTMSGDILGTPAYMAPEQARGERAGPEADVYGLGATLYELVTGRPPFAGGSAIDVVRQVLDRDPARPTSLNPELDRDVETIVLKAMEKDPARRYAGARELAEDLRRLTAGEAIQARPASPAYRARKYVARRKAVVSAVALLATGLGYALFSLLWPGRVSVKSTPPGAAIIVDGNGTETRTPGTVLVWPPGRHRVEILADTYETAILDLDVGAGQRLERETTLVRAIGTLRVDSDPSGASVLVDGKPAGTTPIERLTVPRGRHAVTVQLDGHEPVEAVVDVSPDGEAAVEKRLVPYSGRLTVSGNLHGIEARIESLDATARSPLVLTLPIQERPIPTGRYRLTYTAPNTFPRVVSLTVERDRAIEAAATLVPMRLWSAALDSDSIRAPAVGDFNLDGLPDCAVGTPSRGLIAIDGRDGSELWRYSAAAPFRSSGLSADLDGDAVDDVVAGSDDGVLHAVSGADGRALWTRRWPVDSPPGYYLFSSTALADLNDDGTLDCLIVPPTGPLAALSGRDGTTIWSLPDDEATTEDFRVGRDHDADGVADFFVALGGGRVELRSGRTAEPIWRHALDGRLLGHIAEGSFDGDGIPDIAVSTAERAIVALSGKDGSEIWSQATPDWAWGLTCVDVDEDGLSELYVKIKGDGAVLFRGSDRAVLWSIPAGGASTPPAVVDVDGDGCSDFVLVGADRRAVAVSGRTGATLWTFELPTKAFDQPVVADVDGDGSPDCLMPTQDGTLLAARLREGPHRWTAPFSNSIVGSPTILDEGACLAAASDGTLTTLSLDDGRLLRRVSTGLQPLVRDEPTAADVDGDGATDWILEAFGSDFTAVSGSDGTTRWTVATRSPANYPPPTLDADGDGRTDIVAMLPKDGIFAASGTDGGTLWVHPVGAPMILPPLKASDIDADGVIDVIVVPVLDKARAISGADGTLLWETPDIAGLVQCASVGDVNGDGRHDLIFLTLGEELCAFSGADGTSLGSWKVGARSKLPIAVSDFNGDGAGDCAIVLEDARLFVFSPKAGKGIWIAHLPALPGHSPALSDVDGDGAPECVLTAGGDLLVLSGRDGAVLQRTPCSAKGTRPTLFESEDGPAALVPTQEQTLIAVRLVLPDRWTVTAGGTTTRIPADVSRAVSELRALRLRHPHGKSVLDAGFELLKAAPNRAARFPIYAGLVESLVARGGLEPAGTLLKAWIQEGADSAVVHALSYLCTADDRALEAALARDPERACAILMRHPDRPQASIAAPAAGTARVAALLILRDYDLALDALNVMRPVAEPATCAALDLLFPADADPYLDRAETLSDQPARAAGLARTAMARAAAADFGAAALRAARILGGQEGLELVRAALDRPEVPGRTRSALEALQQELEDY